MKKNSFINQILLPQTASKSGFLSYHYMRLWVGCASLIGSGSILGLLHLASYSWKTKSVRLRAGAQETKSDYLSDFKAPAQMWHSSRSLKFHCLKQIPCPSLTSMEWELYETAYVNICEHYYNLPYIHTPRYKSVLSSACLPHSSALVTVKSYITLC